MQQSISLSKASEENKATKYENELKKLNKRIY